jgi:molecular chaperone GrpE
MTSPSFDVHAGGRSPARTHARRAAKPELAKRRELALERSRAEVVACFLPLLDDLNLVTVLAPRSISDHPWVDALRLVRRRMLDGFHSLGVVRFGQPGEVFDPLIHQAVVYDIEPSLEVVRIDAVIRQGYSLGDQTLWPAQVAVSGPPPNESA